MSGFFTFFGKKKSLDEQFNQTIDWIFQNQGSILPPTQQESASSIAFKPENMVAKNKQLQKKYDKLYILLDRYIIDVQKKITDPMFAEDAKIFIFLPRAMQRRLILEKLLREQMSNFLDNFQGDQSRITTFINGGEFNFELLRNLISSAIILHECETPGVIGEIFAISIEAMSAIDKAQYLQDKIESSAIDRIKNVIIPNFFEDLHKSELPNTLKSTLFAQAAAFICDEESKARQLDGKIKKGELLKHRKISVIVLSPAFVKGLVKANISQTKKNDFWDLFIAALNDQWIIDSLIKSNPTIGDTVTTVYPGTYITEEIGSLTRSHADNSASLLIVRILDYKNDPAIPKEPREALNQFLNIVIPEHNKNFKV